MTHDYELRRHERTPLALFGHYTLADGLSLPCETKDVSESGLAIAAPVGGEAGERVVIDLERIGQIEGEIVRSFDGGFAIALKISPERQRELAAQFRAIYETSALGLIEMPMTPDGDADLGLTFDASMTRGDTRVEGETSARMTRTADGATELEFIARPGRSA